MRTKKLIAAAIMAGAAVISSSSPASAALLGYEWRPCYTDGDYSCVWDAKRRGNGLGRSYVIWRGATAPFSVEPARPVNYTYPAGVYRSASGRLYAYQSQTPRSA